MTLEDQKEQFSYAYIRAVAAACQVAVTEPTIDDDSVDLNLRMKTLAGVHRSPQLDIQVKCTAADIFHAQHLSFALELKNFDELRPTDVMVPRILVVVAVPQQPANWLKHYEKLLLLRHCGYWLSLRGHPASANLTKVTVHLPRTNLFNVDQLQAIMQRISNGGFP